MQLPFRKMNGAGNDFVVLDARARPLTLTPTQLRALANRSNSTTKGCDQVIIMEAPKVADVDVFMRIYNADGTESGACGNAARCIAWRIMEEKKTNAVAIQTLSGIRRATRTGKGPVTVDMGMPNLNWQEIPLVREMDPISAEIYITEELNTPVALSMGNPHAVFFVQDASLLQSTDMRHLSDTLQPFFPKGVNVSVAHIRTPGSRADSTPSTIDVTVWERGAGQTPACGTAACAVTVAAWLREPVGDGAEIHFHPSGQVLNTEWLNSEKTGTSLTKGSVLLSGPVEEEFEGKVEV